MMQREKGSFQDIGLPLSIALICVCGNTHAKQQFVNCNEDGIPFSIWEAWQEEGFTRPEGFIDPPETPYGFCVLCPVCGRFYSEKEMELTNEALVSGQVDASTENFVKLVKGWNAHNEDFFRRHREPEAPGIGKFLTVPKKRPSSPSPRPANAPDSSGWNGKEWIEE